MRRIVWLMMINVSLCGATARDAQAQLFGKRTFGQSLQPQNYSGGGMFGGSTPAPGLGGPQSGPTANPNPTGSSQPMDARFMRENRSSSDFVGGNDTRKPVGVINTGPRTPGSQPAALEVTERRVPENLVNPPRQPLGRSRMYEPRLSVAFTAVPRSTDQVELNLAKLVAEFAQRDPGIQATASVTGETVRLQGEVSSEQQRVLIEQMMLFEPGISSVQNDLKVAAAVP